MKFCLKQGSPNCCFMLGCMKIKRESMLIGYIDYKCNYILTLYSYILIMYANRSYRFRLDLDKGHEIQGSYISFTKKNKTEKI